MKKKMSNFIIFQSILMEYFCVEIHRANYSGAWKSVISVLTRILFCWCCSVVMIAIRFFFSSFVHSIFCFTVIVPMHCLSFSILNRIQEVFCWNWTDSKSIYILNVYVVNKLNIYDFRMHKRDYVKSFFFSFVVVVVRKHFSQLSLLKIEMQIFHNDAVTIRYCRR